MVQLSSIGVVRPMLQSLENYGWAINTCVWKHTKNSYQLIKSFNFSEINLGVAYDAVTAYILGSRFSDIGGNQCGTTMAMAAFYTPQVHLELCRKLVRETDYEGILNQLKHEFGEVPTEDIKYSLASSIQKALEEYFLR